MIVALFAGSMAAWAARPTPLAVDDVAPRWTVEVDDGAIPVGPWWDGFQDDGLSEVVRRALVANPDLDAAAGRLDAARGARLVALGPLLPSVNGSLTTNGQPLDTVFRCAVGPIDPAEFAALQGGGPTGGTGTGGTGTGTGGSDDTGASLCWTGAALVNMNWTIDLFGQNLLGHRAAVLEARAAEGDLEASRLLIGGSAARAYLDVVSAQRQVEILQQQLDAQSNLLEVIELRYERGGASGLEVLQQRQTVATTRAALPVSRAAARSQARVLAALLGEGPTDELPLGADLPAPTPLPAIGTPRDLVDRRPDLRAAKARAAAARSRRSAAARGLLPSVSVSANAGINYAAADDFSTIDVWGLGGSVSVPVFNGGRLIGSVRSASGTELATVRAFDTALLGAIRDVENAIVQEQEQALRHRAVDDQVEAARQAYAEARERYLSGIDTFINVLQTQAGLQAAELSLVQAHRDRLGARVQLWTALGGTPATGVTP